MEQSEEIYANVDRKSRGQDTVNRSIDEQLQAEDTVPLSTEPGSSEKRSYRVAAVCLGLLCVLLAGIIGLYVHYDGVSKSFLAYKTNLSAERDHLQTSYNNLTKERDQLQTSNNNLTTERDQLQTSYNNLTKKIDQLQTSYNNLTKERDQLQAERDVISMRLTNCKQTCPEGWQKFKSSCYFLSAETKTWKESRENCLERGADLVIIDSDKEQEFLFKLNKRVWIGLTDSVTEETWRWVDGTPLTTTRYWNDKQPDSGDPSGEEDCVEIHKDWIPLKAWNDMSCDWKLNWICEKVV